MLILSVALQHKACARLTPMTCRWSRPSYPNPISSLFRFFPFIPHSYHLFIRRFPFPAIHFLDQPLTAWPIGRSTSLFSVAILLRHSLGDSWRALSHLRSSHLPPARRGLNAVSSYSFSRHPENHPFFAAFTAGRIFLRSIALRKKLPLEAERPQKVKKLNQRRLKLMLIRLKRHQLLRLPRLKPNLLRLNPLSHQ